MMDLTQAEKDLIATMQQIAKLDGTPMDADTHIRLTKLKIRALTLVEKIEAAHKARHENTLRRVRKARQTERMSFVYQG